MATPRSVLEAVKHFSDPDNCLEYLVARRWPNGVTCPTCGSDGVYFDKSRQGWICKTKHPLRKFSLKTGTIFEDSPLGLAMHDEPSGKFSGTVEADETYIGGKARNMHYAKRKAKVKRGRSFEGK